MTIGRGRLAELRDWLDQAVTRDSPLTCTSLSNSHSPQLAMFSSLVQKSVLSTATRATRLNCRPVLARAYHEKVISHYENPRNVSGSHPTAHAPAFLLGGSHYLITSLPQVGSLPKNDIDVGTGLVGAPAYVLLGLPSTPSNRSSPSFTGVEMS